MMSLDIYLTREYTIFQNQTVMSITLHINYQKLSKLSKFKPNITEECPHCFIYVAPQEYYVPPMPKTKKTHGKSLFFPGELGNG